MDKKFMKIGFFLNKIVLIGSICLAIVYVVETFKYAGRFSGEELLVREVIPGVVCLVIALLSGILGTLGMIWRRLEDRG